MTPRHVDVAFVLEGVPGVVEVYALDSAARSTGNLELAVKVRNLGGALARAHYALLRVLSHDECRGVLFFEVDLPPSFRPHASRLELSAAEREAARARVPETIAEPEPEAIGSASRTAEMEPRRCRILIIDADIEVSRAGDGAVGVVESDPVAAFWTARNETFDLILLDARLAFGRDGLLPGLLTGVQPAARQVVLLAREGERDLVFASLNELQCWNPILTKPIDPEGLLEILHTRPGGQHWRIPVLPPRRPAVVDPPRAKPVRRVLVIDEDPATAKLLASMDDGPLRFVVTSDAWEAVDLVAEPDWALVVCSAAMQTLGGAPFYRLVWNARPDLKSRFVFIAGPEVVPSVASDGSPPAVVERPLTRRTFVELVERLSQPLVAIHER